MAFDGLNDSLLKLSHNHPSREAPAFRRRECHPVRVARLSVGVASQLEAVDQVLQVVGRLRDFLRLAVEAAADAADPLG